MTTSLENSLALVSARLSGISQRLGYEQQHAAVIAKKLQVIEHDKAKLIKAMALIDKAIEALSANGIGTIESVVTDGMRLAFSDPRLSLTVDKQEGKRGNSYSLVVHRGEVSGPLQETFGGGIANVVALLFRVIMIQRFSLAKVLVLDESFNNVYVGYLPMLSRLLRDLTRNQGYTIMAVTHQPMLASAADHVYRLVALPLQPPRLDYLGHLDERAMLALFQEMAG